MGYFGGGCEISFCAEGVGGAVGDFIIGGSLGAAGGVVAAGGGGEALAHVGGYGDGAGGVDCVGDDFGEGG